MGGSKAQPPHDLHFPDKAIADASSILVRLYPGPLSQLIEGMDSILSMPGGCFEQTSSSTYPNVLALDYMKRTKKLTPEATPKPRATSPTGTSGCSPSKSPAAASPGSARRPPTRFSPPTA